VCDLHGSVSIASDPGSSQGFEVNDFGLEEVGQFQHKDFLV
jgi:hypothetical protein